MLHIFEIIGTIKTTRSEVDETIFIDNFKLFSEVLLVDTETLKVILKRNKISQKELAELLSVSQRTLTKKLKLGEFTSTELEILLNLLDFGRFHPMDVFFDSVSSKKRGYNQYSLKEDRVDFEE